jgi:hypothetical protein
VCVGLLVLKFEDFTLVVDFDDQTLGAALSELTTAKL